MVRPSYDQSVMFFDQMQSMTQQDYTFHYLHALALHLGARHAAPLNAGPTFAIWFGLPFPLQPAPPGVMRPPETHCVPVAFGENIVRKFR